MPSIFTIYLRGFILLLVAAALTCGRDASAQDTALPPPWKVKGKLLGKRNDKKAEDVSGIACNSASGFPRQCLVVDDELQGAQIVIVNDGGMIAGEFIRLIKDQSAQTSKLLELDAEGVTYADGYFYVMGSHGHPRHETDAVEIGAKIKANSHLFRLKIDPATITADGKLTAAPEIKDSVELTKILVADDRLKPYVNKPLHENGLTIEGVAVRDGRLYAGLRGPILNDNKKAAILSISLSTLFDVAPPAELHELDLGPGRGVRDLAVYDNTFLVLAGPATESTDEQYSIYVWDGQGIKKPPHDLPKFTTDQGKPEAILPLGPVAGALRFLVLFDGPDEGTPRAFTMPYP